MPNGRVTTENTLGAFKYEIATNNIHSDAYEVKMIAITGHSLVALGVSATNYPTHTDNEYRTRLDYNILSSLIAQTNINVMLMCIWMHRTYLFQNLVKHSIIH